MELVAVELVAVELVAVELEDHIYQQLTESPYLSATYRKPLFISNLHKALIYQQLTESPYLSATYIKPLYISNLQNQTFILSSVQKIGVLALL